MFYIVYEIVGDSRNFQLQNNLTLHTCMDDEATGRVSVGAV